MPVAGGTLAESVDEAVKDGQFVHLKTQDLQLKVICIVGVVVCFSNKSRRIH